MPELLEPRLDGKKIYLMAPRTVEQWCQLFHEISGKNIFREMNFGDEAESQQFIDLDHFKIKACACAINLEDSKLIDETIRKIQEGNL